jgi:hypothetical protein
VLATGDGALLARFAPGASLEGWSADRGLERVLAWPAAGSPLLWRLRLEDRPAPLVEDLVRCRVPFRSAGARLLPGSRDDAACSALD